MALEIRVLESYDEAEPLWRDLEKERGAGELTHDLAAHQVIWDGFYREREAVLRVYAALEDGRCVGLIPLLHTKEDAEGSWTFTDDFLIGREYFAPRERIGEILPYLPPHLADDLSCFYVPEPTTGFVRSPGGVVDLCDSEAAYIRTLGKKSRYQLRKVMESNRDLCVEEDRVVRTEEIRTLRERYLGCWSARAGGSRERVVYSQDKVATDLALMGRAQELGKLLALYMRLDGELVAANFSVLRGSDRVDDYLCLRDPSPPYLGRALGIYAVLRNMDACRARGVRWYDLSACLTDYKRRFLNRPNWFYVWAQGPAYEPSQTPLATAGGYRASEEP
jgi:hypothetical protein